MAAGYLLDIALGSGEQVQLRRRLPGSPPGIGVVQPVDQVTDNLHPLDHSEFRRPIHGLPLLPRAIRVLDDGPHHPCPFAFSNPNSRAAVPPRIWAWSPAESSVRY